MRNFCLFVFLQALLPAVLLAQSEQAKKVAESFLGTPRANLAADILVNKPDCVYVPQENFQVLSDSYNDHFQVYEIA